MFYVFVFSSGVGEFLSLLRDFLYSVCLLWGFYPSFFLRIMPLHNPIGSNKRTQAAAGLSDNEPIPPLHDRVSDEANRMWYHAKLKNELVVERTIETLLEFQIGS